MGIAAQFGERSFAADGGFPRRTLGHTGEQVSILGLGGYHLGMPSEQEALRIVRTALDSGMNFLDNCWDYNDGASEERMGKALRDGYRQKAFLMTKIDGRDARSATRQLEQSLRRLETDHLDLLQFHEIIRMEDAERIFAAGGAMEAVVRAREAGKLRYIGFTGHKSPHIHSHMLEVAERHNFTFDTVQMPLNVMDAHYESFAGIVLPMLQRKNIGVLGMKPMGSRTILQSKTVSAPECLRYALSLPTSVVITGCDSMERLQQALEVGRSFRPLTAAEVTSLLNRTAQAAKNGQFEGYKTSHEFDGTWQHPEWLG
ncbi:MAG TPA: aldo/keto reductase [Candidatus Binatia bacterium]|nr:aldo/keto reductase [Candidatus Binatia bacterium]